MSFDALFVHGIWRTFCAWHLTQIEIVVIRRRWILHVNWRRIYFFHNFSWIFSFKLFFHFFFKNCFWKFILKIFLEFFFKTFFFKFFFNFFFFLATVKLSNSLLCKYILCLTSFWKLTLFQHFLGCSKWIGRSKTGMDVLKQENNVLKQENKSIEWGMLVTETL